MMKKSIKYYQVFTTLIYIWIGFVGAISFMEAWLKFQAEGVTLSIGVAIGNLVFNALNKVEIILCLGIIFIIFLDRKNNKHLLKIALIPILMLLIQTVYILPKLDERVMLILENKPPPKSYLHLIYVIFEIIKVISLFVLGAKGLQLIQKT